MFNRVEKEKLNLVEIAVQMGYSIDTKKGSSFKAKILKSNHREVFIYDNGVQGFYYQNQHDKSDKGTAIDFVMSELNCDFIRAKEYILNKNFNSEFCGQNENKNFSLSDGKKTNEELANMIAMNKPITHSTILKNRGISIDTLSLSSTLDNACIGKTSDMFFHSDLDGNLTGYEYISEKGKGFGKNCSKSLFLFSKNGDDSDKLIIVENAIEAYSIAELSKLKGSDKPLLIASTGGRPSQSQISMIAELCKVRSISAVLAHDNDNGGDEQATAIATVLNESNIPNIRYKPSLKDWNDDLLNTLK